MGNLAAAVEAAAPAVELWPYAVIDGMATMRDSQIAGLYDRMRADGSVARAFLDGSVQRAEDLIRLFKATDVMAFVPTLAGEAVGFYWLTNFVQCSCQLHYVFFKPYWGGAARTVGRHVLAEMITLKFGGKFAIDVIIGMVPATNRLAVRYAQSVGMVPAGIVPNYYYNFYTGGNEDALLTHYSRRKEI